jgi:hypothetical protein
MNVTRQILDTIIARVSQLAVTTGNALQLRGLKEGGTNGQVPVKTGAQDFSWSWQTLPPGTVSSTTAPSQPVDGLGWFDLTTGVLSYWNKSQQIWIATQ